MRDRGKTRPKLLSEIAELRQQLRAVEAERDALLERRYSPEHVQSLLDVLPEVAFIADLDWRLLAVNRAFLDMHGAQREAVLGKTLLELGVIDPEHFGATSPVDMAKMLAEGSVCNVERMIIDKNGAACPMLISMSLLNDAKGNPAEMLLVARNIGDLKAAMAAKEESQCRYRLLFETGPDAVFAVDFDSGIIEDVNQRACELMGKHRDRIIGMHFSELHPEEERSHVHRLFQTLATGATGPARDCHIKTADGRRVPVEIVAGLLGCGGRTTAVGVFRDVTERTRAAEAIRQSEQRYRDLVEGMVEVVMALDMETHILSVNSAVTQILGLEPDELVGRSFTSLILPGQREAVAEQFARVVRGENVRSETMLVDRVGRAVHVECSTTPVKKSQTVVGFQAVLWDISRRKMLECKLRESEERYRTLVEGAGEAIATVDADGVFRFMNSTAARRLGGRPGDYVGKTMWDIFSPEVAGGQMAFIRGVLASGQGGDSVSMSEVRGQRRWYNTTVEPLRDSSGDVTAALVIARDIHEFKLAQEALDAYRERFVRAEQLASVGTLSATLAHELTQPLTVIRLSIQNSLEDLEGISCPDRVLEDLRDGLAEIASVTAIAERFRNYARRTSEKIIRNVALGDVVQRVTGLLRESARRSSVVLETDGFDDLPEIPVYEKDMEQLVFALAQNAIQAADGQGQAHCRITGRCDGDCIELRFTDDCGGIAPDHLPHVFEPFFTTKPTGEGTGLGLCIVERVVSQAHGRVHVESDYGRGTTFVVTLPIKGD